MDRRVHDVEVMASGAPHPQCRRLVTIAVGVLHLGVARVQYDTLSFDALWFAGSGLAVVLIGTLSLQARSASAPAGARWAAAAANLAGLALAVAFGVLTRWREPQGPLLVALFLAGGTGAMLTHHDSRNS